MNEDDAVAAANEILRDRGIDDTVTTAGWFYPRGHTGSAMAGGLAGESIGDVGGDLAGSIGMVAGYFGAAAAHDRSSGLPKETVVGVSDTHVYLFDVEKHPHLLPHTLFARFDRSSIGVEVHQRVNVRILELKDAETGAAAELEGSRIPSTHSGDVIKALTHARTE